MTIEVRRKIPICSIDCCLKYHKIVPALLFMEVKEFAPLGANENVWHIINLSYWCLLDTYLLYSSQFLRNLFCYANLASLKPLKSNRKYCNYTANLKILISGRCWMKLSRTKILGTSFFDHNIKLVSCLLISCVL